MMSDRNGSNNPENGITVLGTGSSKSIIFERPTSSGRRSTTPKLLQRSGSTLEILPVESEVSALTNSKNHHEMDLSKSDTKNTIRQSSSKRDGGDKMKMKSSESNTCSAHKKVVLPSVKRDFEKHGMPNNEEFESFVRSTTPTLKDVEQKSYSTISSLETGIHGIQLQNKSRTEDSAKEVCSDDDYHASHHCQSELNNDICSSTHGTEPETSVKQKSLNVNDEPVDINVKTNCIKRVTSLSDDYYVSHGQSDLHKLNTNQQEEDTKHETSVKKASRISAQKVDEDDDSSDESDDEEERKAPIELYGEFLETVMDEDFENAQKLCQMILIYEPDNKEANEFKPLIDEELRKERERQLWGSSSEEESSEEEDSDEETDDDSSDDDDDDKNDRGSDDDSN